MRTFTLSLILSLFAFAGFGQTFYIEPHEKGVDSKIKEKLSYSGLKISETESEADYKIKCLLSGRYNAMAIKRMFQGYITITDLKSGTEVAKSKEVKRNPAAINGFNAGANIFGVIADKYLLDLVKPLK